MLQYFFRDFCENSGWYGGRVFLSSFWRVKHVCKYRQILLLKNNTRLELHEVHQQCTLCFLRPPDRQKYLLVVASCPACVRIVFNNNGHHRSNIIIIYGINQLTTALTLPLRLKQMYLSWDGEYNLVIRLEVLGSPATQLSLINLTETREQTTLLNIAEEKSHHKS